MRSIDALRTKSECALDVMEDTYYLESFYREVDRAPDQVH